MIAIVDYGMGNLRSVEKALQSIPQVYQVRSTASESNAQIFIIFNFKKNLVEASDEIRNAIASVRHKLPVEMREPILFREDSSAFPIMQVSLSSQTQTHGEISRLLEEREARVLGLATGDPVRPPERGGHGALDGDRLVRRGVRDRRRSGARRRATVGARSAGAGDAHCVAASAQGVRAWLARRGAKPVGIDNSEEQLATARRMQAEHALAFQFVLDRLQSLNLIAWVREPGAIHIAEAVPGPNGPVVRRAASRALDPGVVREGEIAADYLEELLDIGEGRPQIVPFDRPFHYQIVHVETGLPLFMGTVADPR